MRQDTFENNIKKQLEEKLVSPSDNAWSNLELMLDENKNKKNKQRILPYLVASCIVVSLLFVGYLNLVSSTNNQPKTEIAKEEIQNQKQKINESIVKEEVLVKKQHTLINKKELIKVKVTSKQFNNAIAYGDDENVLPSKNKSQEVVLNKPKVNNDLMSSNIEIDNLLSDAMLELEVNDSLKTLDSAINLLAEVEEDIEIFSSAEASNDDFEEVSIKSKLLKQIKKEFKKTKKSFTSRND